MNDIYYVFQFTYTHAYIQNISNQSDELKRGERKVTVNSRFEVLRDAMIGNERTFLLTVKASIFSDDSLSRNLHPLSRFS